MATVTVTRADKMRYKHDQIFEITLDIKNFPNVSFLNASFKSDYGGDSVQWMPVDKTKYSPSPDEGLLTLYLICHSASAFHAVNDKDGTLHITLDNASVPDTHVVRSSYSGCNFCPEDPGELRIWKLVSLGLGILSLLLLCGLGYALWR